MYKFCPVCGKATIEKSPILSVCSVCDFHFYQNPIPTTGVIIVNKENKVLLVKRKFPPKKGFWDIPGGFIEKGETAEGSLRRELKEEIGFSPKKLAYFSSYPSQYSYQGVNYSTLCLIYFAKIKSQKIKIGDDVAGFKWFSYKEIPFDSLAFSFIKEAIRDSLG
jgi:mutator protein MutT